MIVVWAALALTLGSLSTWNIGRGNSGLATLFGVTGLACGIAFFVTAWQTGTP